MNSFIRRHALPIRTFLAKIVTVRPVVGMSLMEKVASIVASEKIDGDYLEFGVFRGGAFIESYHALRQAFEQRIGAAQHFNGTAADSAERRAIWNRLRFFAFDSFEGLPELQGIDKRSRDFAQGQYAAGVDEFLDNVTANGVPADKVICVPGWFDQTCNAATIEKYKLTKAAVIWIDCDLYHSTKSVLDFIPPLLQDGTVIIFDDWYSFRGNPRLGEQRAFAEWQQGLQGFTLSQYKGEGAWRNSFIVSEVFEATLPTTH
ncbi:MAG: TylF/MycF/NovP-related O-methyltransferase [Rhizomicrobium sp.]